MREGQGTYAALVAFTRGGGGGADGKKCGVEDDGGGGGGGGRNVWCVLQEGGCRHAHGGAAEGVE